MPATAAETATAFRHHDTCTNPYHDSNTCHRFFDLHLAPMNALLEPFTFHTESDPVSPVGSCLVVSLLLLLLVIAVIFIAPDR